MLDSAGLARLVSAQRRARRGGWKLVLCAAAGRSSASSRRRSSSSTSRSCATSPAALGEPQPAAEHDGAP